jgi:outer membrane receptor for monomeric catechols
VRLSIPERIYLFNLLPEKGQFTTMRAVHELRLALELTSEEVEKTGYEITDTGSRWDNPMDVDIPIDVVQFGLCRDALKKLNDKSEITLELLSLYEKFVETQPLVAVNE